LQEVPRPAARPSIYNTRMALGRFEDTGHAGPPRPHPAQEDLAKVGARLRGLRKELGWKLEDVARRTGLSAAHLSRIEAGERQPSLTTLFAVAQAYDVSFSALFEPGPEPPDCVVVRADEGRTQRGNGLFYSRLSGGGMTFNMKPLRVVLPADGADDAVYRHEGEQWMYVLSGRMLLCLGEEEYALEAGDAAHFDSSKPHRLGALDGRDAEVILVACSVPYLVLRSYL
jgi:transcriptional regulator with XRE-family HTH domain